MSTAVNTSDREMVITRLIDAPKELVWNAWTQPGHVINWWGPDGFTTTIQEMEVKPGGVWRLTMHGPDGRDYLNKIIFNEVEKPDRLVYTHSSDGEEENVSFKTTITFVEQDGKTLLTMSALFPTAEEKARVIKEYGALEGGKQTLGRLEQYLNQEDKTPFIIERVYNAPIDKVWSALTNKDEMKKWYFDLETFKPEPGFEFSFYGQGLKGENFLHYCVITDAIPNKKLRYSWSYDKYPGMSYVSFELFPEGNKTRLKLTHEGLDSFPADKEDFAKQNFVQGWTEITGTSLKNYLEGTAK